MIGAQPQRPPKCPRCRYVLTGLAESKCPECGSAFDWNDPALYAYPHDRALAQMARAAPPIWLNWAFVLLGSAFFALLSTPNGAVADSWSFFLFALPVLTGAAWTVAFLLHLAGRMLMIGWERPPWRWRWLAIPAVIGVGLFVQDRGLFWYARWRLARSGFERIVRAPNPTATQDRWVGAFHITSAGTYPDGSLWFELGAPDIYSQGPPALVHSAPGSAPPYNVPPYYGPSYVDLGGGWWLLFNPT